MKLKYKAYILILAISSVACQNKYSISARNDSDIPLNLRVDNISIPGQEQNIWTTLIEPKGGRIPTSGKDQFYTVGNFEDKTTIKTTLLGPSGIEVKSDRRMLLSDAQVMLVATENDYQDAKKDPKAHLHQ